MYGVILWSDQNNKRAVIWCEDHGDLAFYKSKQKDEFLDNWCDPGDLVRFDIENDGEMRLASNLTLVAADEYPTLARHLKQASAAPVSAVAPSADAAHYPEEDKIVPFAAVTENAMTKVCPKQYKAL